MPFTTGFLAKFGVVGATVATHAYVLAAIAMVTAAIAVFFYLRVAVAMYSPVGAVADPVEDDVPSGAGTGLPAGPPDGASSGLPASEAATGEATGVATGRSESSDAVTSLAVLTDAPPTDEVTERGAVPVPVLTWVAIGLCVGFTVVFGIVPEPILNFAHQATLLFT